MKFQNRETGSVLEPRNEAVAAQYADNDLFEIYVEAENAGERPLEKMKKPELLKLAVSMNIQAPEKATVADLIELIREAQDQQP